MADSKENKKPPTGVKKTPSFKSESETQTSVAMRVPSIKKNPMPEIVPISDKLVTEEQTQNAAIARRRRLMTKNRAQNVRTREKTPEPSRTPLPHEDTTTTDEEDQKSPKSPFEIEADDIYAEMRRKVAEQKGIIKDPDDIDLDALNEARAEEVKERRRRSISPFAIPSKEEIEKLQRKGSFIDPDNKLLTTIPSYPLTPKDEMSPGSSRRDSMIEAKPPSPSFPAQQPPNFQLSAPPQPKKSTEVTTQQAKPATPLAKTQDAKKPTTPTKTTPVQIKPKSCIKAPTNESNTTTKDVQTPTKEQSDVPPVRPKRSKSGTRSQGRTSESEMSEDQSKPKKQPEPHRAPKPKERRRTIAAIKRQNPENSPQVKRSKSATRTEKDTGLEITKTSSEIIELLQKARNASVSIPDKDERISNAVKAYVDRSRQLETPTKTVSSRRGSKIICPKTIEVLTEKEAMETLQTVQRQSMEIQRSRRSSGYIDASQSEITSSCYSSSYSEDESDFDLTKKKDELEWKLSLLEKNKKPETKSKDDPAKKQAKKTIAKKEIKPSEAEPTSEADVNKEISDFKRMRKNFRLVWRQFNAAKASERATIRMLVNRCFSDLVILIIFCGLGGVLFRYTEGAFENFYKCGVKRVKRDFVDTLWQGSHNLREEDWKSMARHKLMDFENQLHTAHEAGVHSYSGQKSWSFLNSMVYCLTVVTTIGYGHIAPTTTTGRAITIVYAVFGIPLFLILLADFGKLFTRGIKFLWAFVRRLYFTGSCRKVRKTAPVQEVMKGFSAVYTAASTFRRPSQYEVTAVVDDDLAPKLPPKSKSAHANLLSVPSAAEHIEGDDVEGSNEPQTPAPSVFEIDDEFNLPISVAIVILVIYIFIGATVYTFWEDWHFFESFYFVFISMSTIGFGDFVPKHPMYMMASIVYLVFGLALTSMCINVVQVKLSDSFRQASAKIGATIGLKVSEEDGSLAPVTPPPVEIPEVHGSTSHDEASNKLN